ncbi:hypothetical protein P3T39_003358 [Kitasatospora sp. GP82]|nr:hypothetical protein [Kitasatospora sp. GP82]
MASAQDEPAATRAVLAAEVEALGPVAVLGVVVGRADGQQYGLPGGDGHPANGDVLQREAADREWCGAVVAGEFLDGGGEQLGVAPKLGELFGVVEEGEDAVADELDGVPPDRPW